MVYHPFRHLGLKIVAVAIAFLLWLTVAGEHVVERSLRIPLEFQNMPERLELVEVPPSTVDVRVRGSSGLLGQIQPNDLVAVVDLAGARPGRRPFGLSPGQIRVPFGIEIAQVSPSTLWLEFEPSGTRMVPIEVTIEGKPAHGYEVQSVTVDPPEAEVVGPETPLANIEHAITEPVSIANATRTVREKVTVGVQNPSLRLRSVRNVVVTVEIRPVPMERTFKELHVQVHNAGERTVSMVPEAVSVTVRGLRERLEALEGEPLAPFVDLAGLRPGRYNLEVHVPEVPGVEILEIEPKTVRVTLR